MSIREDYAAGRWTPPCAWCGKASDRMVVVSPGMVHTADTGTFRLEFATEFPCCEQCGPAQVRVSPSVRRARIKYRATLEQRRQLRLL